MEDLTSVFGKAGNKSDHVLLEPRNYLFCVGPAHGQWSMAGKNKCCCWGYYCWHRVQLWVLCSAYAQDVFLSKTTFDVSKRRIEKEPNVFVSSFHTCHLDLDCINQSCAFFMHLWEGQMRFFNSAAFHGVMSTRVTATLWKNRPGTVLFSLVWGWFVQHDSPPHD